MEIHNSITLASGKQFPCDYLATSSNGYMFISINADPSEIVSYFTNKAETASIIYGEHELKNYSFAGLQKVSDDSYKVMLRKAFGEA